MCVGCVWVDRSEDGRVCVCVCMVVQMWVSAQRM